MTLLHQQEIEALLRALPPLVAGFDVARLGTAGSPVRGASLDLTIGEIFLPGTIDGTLGGSDRGKQSHVLRSGETAVVRTAETLQLPGNIAAVGFPPSTAVSLAGLLTTNPGHVDPGYHGPLHLTVINMGHENFTLRRGERIMRLMLFQVVAGAVLPPAASPISEELLGKLSPDFLNVRDRVAQAIERAGWHLQLKNAWLPILAAIISGAGAFLLSYFVNVQQMKVDIAGLQAKVEAKVDMPAIEQRLKALEARVPAAMGVPGGTKP